MNEKGREKGNQECCIAAKLLSIHKHMSLCLIFLGFLRSPQYYLLHFKSALFFFFNGLPSMSFSLLYSTLGASTVVAFTVLDLG